MVNTFKAYTYRLPMTLGEGCSVEVGGELSGRRLTRSFGGLWQKLQPLMRHQGLQPASAWLAPPQTNRAACRAENLHFIQMILLHLGRLIECAFPFRKKSPSSIVDHLDLRPACCTVPGLFHSIGEISDSLRPTTLESVVAVHVSATGEMPAKVILQSHLCPSWLPDMVGAI